MPTAVDIYRPGMNEANPRGKTGPISAARLEKAAFDYLGRYMASTETLRRVLERRVLRAARSSPIDQGEAEAVIADVVAKCQRLGLVDDQRFAEVRAASLARRGDSPR
ncbi:MAG: regulatory protein RecX, partial [Pseudomonadota bacterium]